MWKGRRPDVSGAFHAPFGTLRRREDSCSMAAFQKSLDHLLLLEARSFHCDGSLFKPCLNNVWESSRLWRTNVSGTAVSPFRSLEDQAATAGDGQLFPSEEDSLLPFWVLLSCLCWSSAALAIMNDPILSLRSRDLGMWYQGSPRGLFLTRTVLL